ncbi:AHH domain-containing protein [Paenibacillus kobensis]|uniref:AHH domain-containing protein n=1 Tax=Paenibacillus kobensis TaxID=59841 RepID=UPI000FDB50B6|nr:AHH domain-containing protein [Paenibacillus kobensis]
MIYSDPTGHFAFLLPLIVPVIVGAIEIGGAIAAAQINEKINEPTVVQQPKVEQKPVVSQQPVAQQKPTVSQQPVAQQKPTVSQQPKVEQKVTVSQQPVINSGPTVQEASPSRILRANMIKAGKVVPSYPNAAHHIVAYNDPRAARAQAILAQFGIGLNSAANGVFLPTVQGTGNAAYHPSLHTNLYFQTVENELSNATNPSQAVQILADIESRLLNGTFPK